MPRKREQTPFDKLMMVRSRLRMYVEYGDHALGGQTPQEFAAEIQESMDLLMDFRNMVNSMASLEETPQRAVLVYVDDLREKVDA